MGVVSPYVSDDEVVNSLRGFFDCEKWYSVDFYHWLGTARLTSDGVLVTVESRSFLVHPELGVVIREVL